MPRSLITLAVTTCALSVPSLAAAKTVTVRGEGVHQSVRCDGTTTLRVLAANARVTATGTCRTIIVNGTQSRVNAIVVDRIVVNGVDARVTYRRARSGGPAAVTINGVGGRVFRIRR